VRPGREGKLLDTKVRDEEGNPIFIALGDVKKFFTDAFWEAYEFYATSEILEAPPFSGGWTTWPAIAMQTLLLFKAEANRYENEELKKTRDGHDD